LKKITLKYKKHHTMDIKLEKKPWYIRYRYYLMAGGAFVIFLIYVISLSLGPRKLRIESDNIQIVEVKNGKFMEYVDVEGLVQPILTIKVNTREAGSVERIVAEEGTLMKKGDTILVLTNPDLLREIEDQRDEWENLRYSYQEREIEMEQKTLNLKQQALQTNYEMSRLQKSFGLEKEEYKMGIKSKAQLEVSEAEYNFNLKKAALEMESLRQDSAMTIIRKDLLRNERERGQKKFLRSMERLEGLVVRAPINGQLSYVNATPGQQVSSNSNIAEIKVLDQYKIHTQLSEYYIDRITTGLPATVNYQGKKYPLKITKVVPEVKDRMFDVDLVFTAEMPENVRVGKSFRVQIELGQPEDALVMPRGNFYQATGGQWIYKVNASKDKAVRMPLTIGRQNPQQYEITEGLQVGDLVIVTGYDTFGEAEELILK
jgi:RND family efflux transporter MFP subunit